MREAQLDKVYNGSFKCHRAGPDISWLDTESEPEREGSQGEPFSSSDQNKRSRVTESRPRPRRRHLHPLILALGEPQLSKLGL